MLRYRFGCLNPRSMLISERWSYASSEEDMLVWSPKDIEDFGKRKLLESEVEEAGEVKEVKEAKEAEDEEMLDLFKTYTVEDKLKDLEILNRRNGFSVKHSKIVSWELKIPDSRGQVTDPAVWLQPDWTAIYWPNGFLNILHYGGPESSCVSLEPHVLSMHLKIRQVDEDPEIRQVEETKTQELSADLTIADDVRSRIISIVSTGFGPSCLQLQSTSDSIGTNQLRLQMSAQKDGQLEFSTTESIQSPWGMMAIFKQEKR